MELSLDSVDVQSLWFSELWRRCGVLGSWELLELVDLVGGGPCRDGCCAGDGGVGFVVAGSWWRVEGPGAFAVIVFLFFFALQWSVFLGLRSLYVVWLGSEKSHSSVRHIDALTGHLSVILLELGILLFTCCYPFIVLS